MSETKEHPILFLAPMVRAILDGRKTVTRRVMKSQPDNDATITVEAYNVAATNRQGFQEAGPEIFGAWWRDGEAGCKCPFGKPGERLWVRETWGVISHTWNEHGDMIDWVPDRPATAIRELPIGRGYYSGHVIYAADGANEWAGDDDGGGEPRSAWHPSIHLPRAACRILLEITDVRVERLQDITYEQAAAEGVHRGPLREWCASDEGGACHKYPVPAFRDLWQSVGGDWAANPWVWVIEFKRVTP